jgi:hypothetical protein
MKDIKEFAYLAKQNTGMVISILLQIFVLGIVISAAHKGHLDVMVYGISILTLFTVFAATPFISKKSPKPSQYIQEYGIIAEEIMTGNINTTSEDYSEDYLEHTDPMLKIRRAMKYEVKVTGGIIVTILFFVIYTAASLVYPMSVEWLTAATLVTVNILSWLFAIKQVQINKINTILAGGHGATQALVQVGKHIRKSSAEEV